MVLGISHMHVVLRRFPLSIANNFMFGEIDINQSSIVFNIKKAYLIKHLIRDWQLVKLWLCPSKTLARPYDTVRILWFFTASLQKYAKLQKLEVTLFKERKSKMEQPCIYGHAFFVYLFCAGPFIHSTKYLQKLFVYDIDYSLIFPIFYHISMALLSFLL